MKLGLQINDFSWPGGDAAIGPTLARIARTADAVGFDSIWVMDHLFQIGANGRPEEPMLEGFTTLGHLAALTSRARLGLMVGGIHYRSPALWLKATTTLDVLSGGRAWFGIGAAWNEEESAGLGIPMPPLSERFELLEETLRYVRQGWQPDAAQGHPFQGRHIDASRVLNVPRPLSRPRPPILVGGGGELRTLRLVARYADACNVFGSPDQIRHKYAVLREHCEREGRAYASIERTNLATLALPGDGARDDRSPDRLLERLGRWAEAGSMHTIVSIRDAWDTDRLELIGRDVIPHLRGLGDPSPLDGDPPEILPSSI